jgi:peptidoglycan/LPS O-acetylase OafA/YrhL
VLVAATAARLFLREVYAGPPLVFWATSLSLTLDAGVYFVGAAFLAQLGRQFTPRPLPAAVALALLMTAPGAVLQWLDPLLLPYLVIACGLASTPGLRRAARFGDLSYGHYLYAFPLQQFAVQIGTPFAMSAPGLAGVFAITASLAAVSWHLVEKPMLRFKRSRESAVRKTTPAPMPVP